MTIPAIQAPAQSAEAPSGIVKLRAIFSSILPQAVKLTGLLTVAGFFVVHSYLESLTRLFTYNVSIVQYLAAGISLILFMVFAAVNYVVEHAQIFLLAALAGIILGLITLKVGPYWATIVVRFPILRYAKRAFSILNRLYWYFNWGFLGLIVALAALLYGPRNYASMPRSLGGGMPADVLIVFKEDKPMAWPFTITSGQSEKVRLVMELTDGVLVWDKKHKMAVEIKNDAISGIVEAP